MLILRKWFISWKKLLNACTKEIGPTIYSQAAEMHDSRLAAKIAPTDVMVFEVKYHNECYTHF
jgi:hypothetical protein